MLKWVSKLCVAATVVALAASVACGPSIRGGTTVVQEVEPKARIIDDPIVNPANGKPLPPLPAAALAQQTTDVDDDATSGWLAASWTQSSIRVSSAAEHRISLAAPSVVLIKASWHEDVDVAISLVKDQTSLASLVAAKHFDGLRSAATELKVPSAGDLVVQASVVGGAPVNLDLVIGVLEVKP